MFGVTFKTQFFPKMLYFDIKQKIIVFSKEFTVKVHILNLNYELSP
jgi:hypothetical protein